MTAIPDELDPLLSRLFAEAHGPLPADAFLQIIEQRLHQSRRRQLRWGVTAAVALGASVLLLTPLVVRGSLVLAQYFIEGAGGFGTALLSPLGAAGAMAATLYALRKVHAVLA